jgi:hypothetical protein
MIPQLALRIPREFQARDVRRYKWLPARVFPRDSELAACISHVTQAFTHRAPGGPIRSTRARVSARSKEPTPQ